MNNIKYELTARRLSEALLAKDMTQQMLANLAGINKASISQYINGRNRPDNLNAYKMGKWLDVNPEWLMGFNVPMKKINTIPEYDPIIQELIIALDHLTADQRKQVLDMAHFLEHQNANL